MTIERKVKRAIDGDTLEVGTKIRGTNYIRIAGIDTPERGEIGYTSAKDKLNKQELNDSIKFVVLGILLAAM